MTLKRRLQQLEVKINLISRQPGCDISLFVVVPEDLQVSFDCDTYRPAEGALEKHLQYLKNSGQCRDCLGSCALDWGPDGFKNHTLTGAPGSSSPTPKIFTMYCADSEIPVLTRRIMNGEQT